MSFVQAHNPMPAGRLAAPGIARVGARSTR